MCRAGTINRFAWIFITWLHTRATKYKMYLLGLCLVVMETFVDQRSRPKCATKYGLHHTSERT